MRLENLYKNFGTSSLEEQSQYLSTYRLRRAEDMAKPPTFRKKKTSVAASAKIALSEEEKLLMKVLGLKAKDIVMLRTSTQETENVEDESILLQSTIFSEDEE